MKKLIIISSIIFAVGMLSAGNAFAVGYCKDVNPPTKDFQETLTLSEGDTVTIDIYINDIRTGDHLIGAGFLAYYSPPIEIVSVTPDAAWHPSMIVIDTSTPNVLYVNVGQLSGVAGDGGNDVRIAAVEIHCLNFGFDQMIFMPDSYIDMIVSKDDSYVYDGDITPNVFTFNQVRCCNTAADCDDGLYCNGQEEYCDTDTSGLCGGYVGMCYRDTNDPCAFCDIYDCTCDEDMDFCVCEADNDCDGICNPGESAPHCTGADNCPTTSNPNQEDTLPLGGNSDPLGGFYCGDACECEGDFEPDGDVDGTDAVAFKNDFFRKDCYINSPCNGDFECDADVDGTDAVNFKQDFFRKDCPSCSFFCSNCFVDEDCDDDNVCTDDACDQPGTVTGCSNTDNSDPCDDGIYCNGADTCYAGSCSLHPGDPCNDDNECSDDTCYEGSKSCDNVCNASSAVMTCCDDPVCDGSPVCQ